jgi:hypothetical protein
MSPPTPLADLAPALCRIFLGWRLREDYAALVALGEGALRIDLLSAEAWCDGEPLPPLFIAGELARELAKQAPSTRFALAQLDAAFAQSAASALGARRPPLDIACRVTLHAASGEKLAAEANNSGDVP